MRTFGLVVEGQYDEAVLTELVKKCIADPVEVATRVCSGSIMNKFSGFLEAFRRVKQGTHVDKALVIRDANGGDPGELVSRMRDKIANRDYPFPVKCVVIVRELETWLLADDRAISQVAGRTVPPVNGSPEDIPAPKERLTRLLAQARVPYTSEVARSIAAAVDIDRLRYRCSRFGRFEEAVRDC